MTLNQSTCVTRIGLKVQYSVCMGIQDRILLYLLIVWQSDNRLVSQFRVALYALVFGKFRFLFKLQCNVAVFSLYVFIFNSAVIRILIGSLIGDFIRIDVFINFARCIDTA